MGAADAAREEHPVATRAGVSRDTAGNRILVDHPEALAATALRTRSVHAREVLVETAWPGRDAEDIDQWAAEVCGAAGSPAHVAADADPFHLGQYARVLVLQTRDNRDVARGRAILEALVACGPETALALPRQAVQVLLHLRCLDRDVDGCEELLGHPSVQHDVAAAVRADLANPFVGRAEGLSGPVREAGREGEEAQQAWLALLDVALESPGLAPVRLDPALGQSPFDQLSTDPLPRADHDGDPLVTVAVSAYRPGPPLVTAVRSLLAQTWHRLEILVVDDASGPEAEPWLRQVEQLGPRVRVIRKAVNGGTYRARNTALRQARGTFFTTLDSDDWLHPQAIATLVQDLQGGPGRVAVRGYGARIGEDLALVRLGYRHLVTAASTLMVRVDLALARAGFLDTARKSADTEYARRLQAAFGDGAVRTVRQSLLLFRGGATLSAGEFSRGWRHGARHAYKTLYGRWHDEIRGGGSAHLDPGLDRPVPEPRRWSTPRDPGLPAPRHLHLVLAGDWRRFGGPQRSMMEELRAARAAGLRVGILQLEALRFATSRDVPLCEPVADVLRRREAEWVQLDDDVDVDVLMVRYPLVLQHPPHVPGGALRPRHLLIVANQAPVEPDGSDQRYVVGDVTDRARELFTTEPLWLPQGPVIRDLLLQQDPDVRLAGWDNPGLIDLAEWRVRPDRVPGEGGVPVVVGRYSRDEPLKFPPTHAEMVRAYTFGPGYEVRLMGAGRTWRRLAAEAGLGEDARMPKGWELLRYRSVDPKALLAGLDFVVYQDHPGRHEAFGRVLLESAASGTLVIAHPRHEAVFGEILDYAEPGQVRGLVESYVAQPHRYLERVEHAQQLVAERFSHASFVRRLGSLPGLGAVWAAERVQHEERGMPWAGEAVLRIAPTGAPREPVSVEAEVRRGLRMRDGAGRDVRSRGRLAVRNVRLRSAADAARADQLVLVHAEELSGATRDRLRAALAVPEDAAVDGAVLAALARSDDLAAVLLCRDGHLRLSVGAGARSDAEESWLLTDGPREVRLTGRTGGR